MAYTIDLEEDLTTAEELQLMKTKHAILRKLHARFGEYTNHAAWEGAHAKDATELSRKRANHSL